MNFISTNIIPNGMIPASKVLQIKTTSSIEYIKCDIYYCIVLYSLSLTLTANSYTRVGLELV